VVVMDKLYVVVVSIISLGVGFVVKDNSGVNVMVRV
jgi:hypothetical protein